MLNPFNCHDKALGSEDRTDMAQVSSKSGLNKALSASMLRQGSFKMKYSDLNTSRSHVKWATVQ